MRIQITPKKRIENALSVWKEVNSASVHDIIMPWHDRGKMDFGDNTIKTAYLFNFFSDMADIDHLKFAKELFRVLKKDGEIYIIENDFDYLCRSFVGGDLKIEDFNRLFTRKSYLNQALIIDLLCNAGFDAKKMKTWFNPEIFKREHFELIISTTK